MRRPDGQAGFTLLELMLGLGLTAVITIGVLGVFNPLTKTYKLVNELSQVQENGRFAMLMMSRDFRMAGYFGHIVDVTELDPDPPTGTETDCGQNWIQRLSEPLIGYDQTTYSADTPYLTCISDNSATSDVMVLRMAETTTTAVDDLVATQDYLFSNFSTGEVIRVATAGVSNAANTSLAGGEYRAIKGLIYYIRDTGGVPALVRHDTTTGASLEVVEGIEDMQLSFGLKSSTGTFVTSYVDSTAIADWEEVMTVRVDLLARSIDPAWNYQIKNVCRDTLRTYALGNRSYTPTDSGGNCYRRRVYTSIYQLRNN